MWTTTSRSSQTSTSCAPLWRSQSCGFTRGRVKTGWMEMDLQNLIAKRRYNVWCTVEHWRRWLLRLLLLIASYFTGRFTWLRQKDGRYQQLQLQSGEGSRSLYILEMDFFFFIVAWTKNKVLCVVRSCYVLVSCVSRREVQGRRVGSSSKGCWGTWELTVWCWSSCRSPTRRCKWFLI